MTTPDHDESKPRRRWPTYLAVALVLVLVVYPLSIGPHDIIGRQLNSETFNKTGVFYRPLVIVVEATRMEETLNSYLSWCYELTEPPSETQRFPHYPTPR